MPMRHYRKFSQDSHEPWRLGPLFRKRQIYCHECTRIFTGQCYEYMAVATAHPNEVSLLKLMAR